MGASAPASEHSQAEYDDRMGPTRLEAGEKEVLPCTATPTF
jgi:hypothetical protein